MINTFHVKRNYSYTLICDWKYGLNIHTWHLQAEKNMPHLLLLVIKMIIIIIERLGICQPNVDLQAHKNEAMEILNIKSPQWSFWYIFLENKPTYLVSRARYSKIWSSLKVLWNSFKLSISRYSVYLIFLLFIPISFFSCEL